MTTPTRAPYGSWASPLSVEKLAADASVGFSQLQSCGEGLFWVESRAHENGRRVIVRERNGDQTDVLPAEFSAVSTVHEYGGVAYCVARDTVYFVNAKDQNLYAVPVHGDADVVQITHSDVEERFADPVFDELGERLLCVRETHQKDAEPINDIVAIEIATGATASVHNGHDFYSNARISPDGSRLAFLAWDHPNMPWNGTQLYVMNLRPTTSDAYILAGGQSESVFQPEWLSAEKLLFCSDRAGFYDLYAYTEDDGIYALTAGDREYGHALWQVGASQYAAMSDTHALVAPDQSELQLLDTFSGMLTPVEAGAASYGSQVKHRDGFAFIQSEVDARPTIRVRNSFADTTREIKSAGEPPLPKEFISIPEPIEFLGTGGEPVYAYFYPPKNPQYTAGERERPPLLVQAHGGPTSRTSPSLSSRMQFYTSRGWAVVDVNYSGSTGYGRAYRDRLLNEWGNRDIDDLAACVRHLIAADLVDAQRVAIAGSSAGGYSVLRALTTTSVFKAGASRYGIADLRALAEDTHKFESRYIDQLVPPAEFDARSPINHVDQLQCPIIFSQGADDKVVPPNQARMMFEALDNKGIPAALFMFEGEGHGFRKQANAMQCMKGEYYFFSLAFGFEPHGIDRDALDGAELAHMDAF